MADSQTLIRAELFLSNMRTNLKARQSVDRAKFQDEDAQILVTQEDFNMFYDSIKAKSAVLALETVPSLLIREIVNLRNFLIASIILENACRPAALYDFKVSTLEKAKAHPITDANGKERFAFPSFQDKTVSSTGKPTYIVLSPQLMERLLIYVRKFRGKIAARSNRDIGDVFLKEKGTKMNTENVSMAYRLVLFTCRS